jgi:quercetin dioxygenase-like cupin family protein
VLEFTAKKGDRTPMHSHPAYVVYIVKAGTSRFTLADGTSFEKLKSEVHPDFPT